MKEFIILLTFSIFATGCSSFQSAMQAGSDSINPNYSTRQLQEKKLYQDYVFEMERINLEREKAGLETKAIKSFQEWGGDKSF